MMNLPYDHREDRLPPRSRVLVFSRWSGNVVHIRGVAASHSVPPFVPDKIGRLKVGKSAFDCTLADLQVCRYRRHGWKAFPVLIGAVAEIQVHRDCPMLQIIVINIFSC